MVGLIDFGDMVYSCTVFEPAIAAAYLMLEKEDPVAAAAAVAAGYHAALPLTEQEIGLLPALIAIRLCISVALAAYQQAQEPDNPYLTVSEAAGVGTAGAAGGDAARPAALPSARGVRAGALPGARGVGAMAAGKSGFLRAAAATGAQDGEPLGL